MTLIKILLAPAATLALCVSASAQQVVDGSDGGIPAAERDVMMQLFKDAYGDTSAIRLRRLSRVEAPNIVAICGEMSSTVAGGKYGDFRKFSVGPKAKASFFPYDAAGEENPLMSIITAGQCK